MNKVLMSLLVAGMSLFISQASTAADDDTNKINIKFKFENGNTLRHTDEYGYKVAIFDQNGTPLTKVYSDSRLVTKLLFNRATLFTQHVSSGLLSHYELVGADENGKITKIVPSQINIKDTFMHPAGSRVLGTLRDKIVLGEVDTEDHLSKVHFLSDEFVFEPSLTFDVSQELVSENVKYFYKFENETLLFFSRKGRALFLDSNLNRILLAGSETTYSGNYFFNSEPVAISGSEVAWVGDDLNLNTINNSGELNVYYSNMYSVRERLNHSPKLEDEVRLDHPNFGCLPDYVDAVKKMKGNKVIGRIAMGLTAIFYPPVGIAGIVGTSDSELWTRADHALLAMKILDDAASGRVSDEIQLIADILMKKSPSRYPSITEVLKTINSINESKQLCYQNDGEFEVSTIKDLILALLIEK